MHNFKNLDVWQRSYRLSLDLIRSAQRFSGPYRFSLGSQITRAAISIPSNIAEGSSRGTTKEFRRFLGIAHGSASELETQVMLARDLALISEAIADRHLQELSEIQRMLYGLRHRAES
jgi:four helix bundle protein